MFPNELEIAMQQKEMVRAAENHRLAQSLRSQPSLWERVRARLSTTPSSRFEPEQQNRRWDAVALS